MPVNNVVNSSSFIAFTVLTSRRLAVRTLLYFQYRIQLTSCVLHLRLHTCTRLTRRLLLLAASQCPLIISSCMNRNVHGLWDLYSSPYSPQRGPTRYSTRPLQVPATMYIVYVYTACCYVLWLRYAYSYSCSLLSALKCRQCFVLFCSSVHQEFLSLCLVLGVYIRRLVASLLHGC